MPLGWGFDVPQPKGMGLVIQESTKVKQFRYLH
jgi:hypothetical protein